MGVVDRARQMLSLHPLLAISVIGEADEWNTTSIICITFNFRSPNSKTKNKKLRFKPASIREVLTNLTLENRVSPNVMPYWILGTTRSFSPLYPTLPPKSNHIHHQLRYPLSTHLSQTYVSSKMENISIVQHFILKTVIYSLGKVILRNNSPSHFRKILLQLSRHLHRTSLILKA